MPRVSVVVPAYNEVESVPLLATELPRALRSLEAEVIVVDDGSSDGTADAVRGQTSFHCLSIRHAGKTEALRRGVDQARGAIVVTIDADLQEDPGQIPELVRLVSEGADLAIAVRRPRADSLWRKKIPSRGYGLLIRLLFGRSFRDINCGFRAARRELFLSVLVFEGAHRLVPLLVARRGGVVREISVQHKPRRFGAPKYDSPRRFVEALRDLVRLRLGGVGAQD